MLPSPTSCVPPFTYPVGRYRFPYSSILRYCLGSLPGIHVGTESSAGYRAVIPVKVADLVKPIMARATYVRFAVYLVWKRSS
jgi:hypothetical protein